MYVRFCETLDIPFDPSETVRKGDGVEGGSDEIECQIMFMETADWKSLICGHKFSDWAWDAYIKTKIQERREVTNITCPGQDTIGGQEVKCRCPVPESLIYDFIKKDPAMLAKYERFIGDSWVAEQADTKYVMDEQVKRVNDSFRDIPAPSGRHTFGTTTMHGV